MFRATVAAHDINTGKVVISHRIADTEQEVVASILEDFNMDVDIADTLKELQDFGYECDLMIIYEIK